MNWDWDDVWQFVGVVAVIGLLAFSIVLALAPKNVDYYYVSHSGQSNTAICIYAHWTWHVDEISFCTDDEAKAMDFVTKANQSIKR